MGKLTESEYTTIKQLLAKGYDGKRVAEIVQRGAGTVSTVKNTDSYVEYKGRVFNQKTAPKKQTELPLDKPKKTTLDLKQDISIKFSNLCDSILVYRTTVAKPQGKQIKYWDKAVECLEEARLWLKETF